MTGQTPASNTGRQLAKAATALLGTPFQLGGRCPINGIDCVGLVLVSLRAIGRIVAPLPGYTLRQTKIDHLLCYASQNGLVPVEDDFRAGDIVLLRPSPAQYHLGICGEKPSLIHAHAGLRRVVAGPWPKHWPIAQAWRLA